jgi:hypothetical protein
MRGVNGLGHARAAFVEADCLWPVADGDYQLARPRAPTSPGAARPRAPGQGGLRSEVTE